MNRIAAATALALGVWLLTPVPPADATEKCVTRAEFHKVKDGMTKDRVKRIFDSGGKESVTIGDYETRNYTPCTDRDYGWVTVNYDRARVVAKDAYWG
jgi:hypothetical protein